MLDAVEAAPAAIRLALVGNPNVGKSAIFNALTGLQQKVANYPGVTVERREGRLRHAGSRAVSVLDLPGTMSLVARAPDEQLAADVLLGRQAQVARPDVAIVVLDAGHLRRGLFLLSQLLECGLPIVVALNMMDEARHEGVGIEAAALSAALGGLPVIETVGTTGEGIRALADAALAAVSSAPSLSAPTTPGVHGLPRPSPERWAMLRDAVDASGLAEIEVQARWRWVGEILQKLRLGRAGRGRAQSDRIDRVLLHPLLGPLVFVLVMAGVFQAVFSLAATPMEWIDGSFAALADAARNALGSGLAAEFVADALVAGVGSVVIFLPQILILFLFLGILEDSGYMTRAAFLVDRPLRGVGLSGRAFIPLLSSFACAVPGIMATRCIEDRRERLLTILVAPLMTCSARLPVYTILIGTFVPQSTVLGFLSLQGLVLLGLYLLGMVLAAVAALIGDRALRKSGKTAAVVEHAPYRLPSARNVGIRLWHRASAFLRRAGTVILAASVIIWLLSTFPRSGAPRDDAQARSEALASSWAGRLGHAIEPAIAPLGYDWRIGIGLIGSFAAREVFVSTMGVVYAVEEAEGEEEGVGRAMQQARRDRTGTPVYSLATVFSLLVFYAIALQCISTLAVVFRETGSWRWTLIQLVAFTSAAWLLSFATYQGLAAAGLG